MARRAKRKTGRSFGCFGLVVLLCALVAAWLVYDWYGPGPAPRPVTVEIASGSSVAKAGQSLEAAGAIRSARRFRWFARALGSDTAIQAGEYRLPARASASAILGVLQGGKTLQRLVTIPEGLPAVMVADTLNRAAGLTGAVEAPAEGSVLPDSYGFDLGATRASVLRRMQEARVAYLDAAWAKRKPGLAVTTPEQALILASIVEKETAKPSERRTVAAVYSNRLKRGMPLQADPTIIYPITKGRPLGRRILRSEVNTKNAYNTYTMRGLPSGPICNPSRASIDAVLDPAASNALYFVADGTGGSVFADTLEQQNANVQKLYALRRARGEM